jgi:hypothetical protein
MLHTADGILTSTSILAQFSLTIIYPFAQAAHHIITGDNDLSLI